MITSHEKPDLHVGFILCDEFPLLSLSGFIEALRHAADIGDTSRKLFCSWSIMEENLKPGLSSCGIPVPATSRLLPSEQLDYVAVVGPLLRNIDHVPRAIHDYLRKMHDHRIPLIGLCTGSFVLADAGIMANRTASLHPYHVQDFRSRHPNLRCLQDRDYLEDKGIFTAPGGVSAIGLATDLIARHCSDAQAAKAVFQMTMSHQQAGTMRIDALDRKRAGDYRVRKAVSYMERNIGTPDKVSGLATRLGISERQLERLFRSEFGISPKVYWMDLRLNFGRWQLLHTSKSVTQIAYEAGFNDCAHFIHHFRKKFEQTPGILRSANNN
ncbi:GlxA family transcriptional regulator [Aestuariispira insulae]|uniref:Transcriptional regulator GlxA family with amidase domain n=1 Tax=Aestuariispira insulae TaxID=1461337 RepID=A0A3D9HVA7_9PROT|nr:helix-turn-helix domain-containing protein [Aestuariispira insulae]RED53443.1 transcriptional regulator GlxA family with amidase domain [Aestuariispira insulae]